MLDQIELGTDPRDGAKAMSTDLTAGRQMMMIAR